MNRAKLKSLVHYIIAKSEPSRLGAIRLNKTLWFSDAIVYRMTGQSMTGETYVKRQHGPVPKHILSILGELELEKAIVLRDRERFGRKIREHIALADPTTDALSPDELALVDEVREYICGNHTAMSISELSHDQVWEAANIGEEIPLSATLASLPGELTSEVTSWADSAIARYEAIEKKAA